MFSAVYFSLLISVLAVPAPPSPGYLFPLERPARITGSFAENRGLRFHAGLDLSTGGEIGLPVRAAAAGSLHRLRVSPFGYGKAVYLKFDDGRYGVYGHLSGFSETLEKLARKKQVEEGEYEIDATFPEGKVAVERGEVIGYTGSSGTRVPHLHFELRDDQERPLNLLTHGLEVKGKRRPKIEGVAVRPLDPFSGVGSFREEMVMDGTDRPVAVWGKFGVSVAAVVPSGDNRLGVWKAELWVDGKLRFVNQYESFSYDQYRQAPLIYDRDLSLKGFRDYQRLYRREGDRLPFHPLGESATGVLQTVKAGEPNYLKPGDHSVRVVARDPSGLSAEKEFVLRVEEPEVWSVPEQFGVDPAESSSPRLAIDFRDDSAVIYLSAPGVGPGDLALSYRPPRGESRPVPLARASGGSHVGGIEFSGEERGIAEVVLSFKGPGGDEKLVKGFLAEPLDPFTGGRTNSPDGKARLDSKSGAVYSVVFPRVTVEPPPELPGLKAHGPTYVFDPKSYAFKKQGTVSLKLPGDRDEKSRIGVYELTDAGAGYLGKESGEPPGWLSAKTETFGKFSLLEDGVPPEIEFEFAAGVEFPTPRPLLVARIDDRGSGIAYPELKARLDGKEVIAEYVPHERLLRYRPEEDLEAGTHKFSVTVADKAGNVVKEERGFEVMAE